jgi:hypothetical protein
MPTIAIYLPDIEKDALHRMAADENRSVSNMVSTLVREGVDRRYVVESVETLPRPVGAKAVPVVTLRDAGQEGA